MNFYDDDDNLFATCMDNRHIIKVCGSFYGFIEGNDIISEDGDFIGSFNRDRHGICVISEYGDMLFYVRRP